MITTKQQLLIEDFLKTAKINGTTFIESALPANHPVMASGNGVQMKAIRKVKSVLTQYNDELGNTVMFTVHGFVKQV